MELKSVIRMCRDYSKMRQNVFCKELGISQTYMSLLEGGHRKCYWDLVDRCVNVSGLNWVLVSWAMESVGDSESVRVTDSMLGIIYGVRIERWTSGLVTGIHKL